MAGGLQTRQEKHTTGYKGTEQDQGALRGWGEGSGDGKAGHDRPADRGSAQCCRLTAAP